MSPYADAARQSMSDASSNSPSYSDVGAFLSIICWTRPTSSTALCRLTSLRRSPQSVLTAILASNALVSDNEWPEIAALNPLRRSPQSAFAACPLKQKMATAHLKIAVLAIAMTNCPEFQARKIQTARVDLGQPGKYPA